MPPNARVDFCRILSYNINGDFMYRKLFLILALTALLFFNGCSYNSEANNRTYEKPVIVLPDEYTAYTINGYKNISDTLSDITSSDSTVTSSDSSYNGRYYASKNSTTYHTKDCSNAKRIKTENLIIFETKEDAENNGYRYCTKCCTE